MQSETIIPVIYAAIGGLVTGLMLCVIFLLLANSTVNSVLVELHSMKLDCDQNFTPGTSAITFEETTWYCRLERIENSAADNDRIQISNSQQTVPVGGD